MEFVNRVNEVGVDVNRCVNQSHTASLIQFVCGLGPRKGYNLLKVILFKLSLGTNDFVQITSTVLCLASADVLLKNSASFMVLL